MSGRSLAVAIPTCSNRREDIRIGYVLQALALQPPSQHFDFLEVYVWDEGAVPMAADRWVQLALDLLVRRGHRPVYLRRSPSKGVAEARRGLLSMVPRAHDRILLVDDDLVPVPGSIDRLLDAASTLERFGFVQGTKIELDATRTYHNDINQLTALEASGEARRLWFGDAAFLLVSRAALDHVRWDVVSRFAEPGLPGEDVAMTLMIADREPCFGVASAAGYHLSLATPRWRWEVPSDLLQLKLLEDVVSSATLRRALPHLERYLAIGSSADDAAEPDQPARTASTIPEDGE
jgi:hypothetical protein